MDPYIKDIQQVKYLMPFERLRFISEHKRISHVNSLQLKSCIYV